MIKAEKTVTLLNDGSTWTLTESEARHLRDQLNNFLGDTHTKQLNPSHIEPALQAAVVQARIDAGLNGAKCR